MKLASKFVIRELENIVEYIHKNDDKCRSTDMTIFNYRKPCLENKIDDLRCLGLASISNGTISLTQLGQDLANANESFEKAQVYRYILLINDNYREVLDGIADGWSDFCSISNNDKSRPNITVKTVSENFAEENYSDPMKLEDAAISFFRLCQAAEYGKLYMGRRGFYTRFLFADDFVEEYNASKDTSHCQNDDKDNILFTVPFKDGRQSSLRVPNNLTKEEASYTMAMVSLMFKHQFRS